MSGPPVPDAPELGAEDDLGAAWRADALRASSRVDRELHAAASGAHFVELGGPLSTEVASAYGWSGPADAALAAALHPAHRDAWWAELEAHRARPTAAAFDRVAPFAVRGQGWRWLRVRAASRPGPEGWARRTVLALVDVTELRRLEERAGAAEARVEVLERELVRLRERPAPRPAAAPRAELAAARREAAASADRLRLVGQAVERAREATPSGPRPSAGRSRRPLDRAAQEARALEPAVRALGKKAPEALPAVTSATEDLALVALNAQLEALHLGTSGSGLAAVAGSMKSLAKATLTATHRLAEAIEADRESAAAVEAALETLLTHLERAQTAAETNERAHEAIDLGPVRVLLDEARRLARPPA